MRNAGFASVVCAVFLFVVAPFHAFAGEPTLAPTACLGLPHCQRLSNGVVELVFTTDVGPRIARYAFVGGANVLAEMPLKPGETLASIDKNAWRSWGGHRLWLAPEMRPRTYAPDNATVTVEPHPSGGVRVRAPVDDSTGVQKEWWVRLDPVGTRVTIEHRLTNRGSAAINLAPWAITVVRGGGTAFVPNEPFVPHEKSLLPVRAMALWSYTNLNDARFSFGPSTVSVRADPTSRTPQKIGFGNKPGWTAYDVDKTLFVKRFPFVADGRYPDLGSNNELFTSGAFMEIETLAPLVTLAPGASVTHNEVWYLFDKVEATSDDVLRAVAKTTGP